MKNDRMWSLVLVLALCPSVAEAFGEATSIRINTVSITGQSPPLDAAIRRIAWETRQRTSVVTEPDSRSIRLDEEAVYDSPFLYWRGEAGFDPLNEAEIIGLRRFLEFGGFLLVDDASQGAFGRDVRRALARALPDRSVAVLPNDHVIYRSFYLVGRPVGRRRGTRTVDAVTIAGRVAVVLADQDLGGAWARDNLGNWLYSPSPGGDRQREEAIRFGINLVMYALCLDYKDDQVHAPYLMRRRGPQ